MHVGQVISHFILINIRQQTLKKTYNKIPVGSWAWPSSAPACFDFFLNGILLHSKSFLYESALRIVEKFKGGKLWAPEKSKECNFLTFFRGHNCSPKFFNNSEGTFVKQTFRMQPDPIYQDTKKHSPLLIFCLFDFHYALMGSSEYLASSTRPVLGHNLE